MSRWYKHGAVLVAWLALSLVAQAQQEIPSPVGAARMVEPLGYCPKPQPPLIPGPVTPEMAPLGPPDSLSLPASHSSAFQCEQYTVESCFYASVGAQGLQRYRLPRLQTAFNEPGARLDVDVVPGPPSDFTVATDLNNLHPYMHYGPRFTVGYLENNCAVELTGYYLSPQTRGVTVTNPALLLVPFNTPAQGVPLGFEGNNGLWLNADKVRTYYSNQIINAEANYRSWNGAINNVELILGVRYFGLQETVGIFTNDDFFHVNIFGQSDPKRAATYTATARNNMVNAQFGGEYSAPLPHKTLGWIWFTGMAKASAGPNFIERSFRLVRGDKFLGFHDTVSNVNFGQLYEAGLYLDLHALERLRFRLGYQALFVVGVSDPGYQVNFDLLHPTSRGPGYRSEFYHGPTFEMQFLF
jgi:hypothetical protein